MKLRRLNTDEMLWAIALAVFFAAAVGLAYYDLMLNGGK